MQSTLAERLQTNLKAPNENGCVEWSRYVNNSGYGLIRRGSQHEGHALVHRVAYELAKGPVPEGLEVMHKCNNKLCCNPDHLEAGTHKQNIHDLIKTGRHVSTRGSRLSDSDLREIVRLRRSGVVMREIAQKFGVSRPMISLIFAGKTKFAKEYLNG